MHVSIEDFKVLPIISGNLNLKWELKKLIPDMNFTDLVKRLDITYQAKYLKNLKKAKRENPNFDEDIVWQYLPQYKVKLDERGLSVFLSSDIGDSYGFLFKVDRKNKELLLIN